MKNKIIDIINTLIDSTKSGHIEWVEKSKSNKRTYERDLIAYGEDGTEFEITVKYILNNDRWIKESTPSLWIRNNELPGGVYYVYGYKETTPLRDLIKDMYCSDMNPKIEDIEFILDKVNKGISLSKYRDNKLNNILEKDV